MIWFQNQFISVLELDLWIPGVLLVRSLEFLIYSVHGRWIEVILYQIKPFHPSKIITVFQKIHFKGRYYMFLSIVFLMDHFDYGILR